MDKNSVKLLGFIIDSALTFNNYVQMICKKASQKLTAIVRLANIISEKKSKVLLKHFSSLNSVIAHYLGCFAVRN